MPGDQWIQWFMIRPPVAELCQVAGRMKMSFKDTRSIFVREQKTKRSNKSACRRLLQVCMGNADVGFAYKLALLQTRVYYTKLGLLLQAMVFIEARVYYKLGFTYNRGLLQTSA